MLRKNKLLIVNALMTGLFCFNTHNYAASALTFNDTDQTPVTLQAGHSSLQKWVLPEKPVSPANNQPSEARIALGKMFFFDPRISYSGNISCATCHNPSLGWSDALPISHSFQDKRVSRNSQSLLNSAYNTSLTWEGKKDTFEDQAMGPLLADSLMKGDVEKIVQLMKTDPLYKKAVAAAYPNEPVDKTIYSRAISNFERTIIARDTPFDKWIQGDFKAMNEQQIRGFRLFIDPKAGNCSTCHTAPNFSDNGFHNIGLASFGNAEPDLGRYNQRKIASMKGAFKTPSLRDVARTAPYFHDGSAKTLEEVIEHYAQGGIVKTNLSHEMKPLTLSKQDKEDLTAFLKALTVPYRAVTFPELVSE